MEWLGGGKLKGVLLGFELCRLMASFTTWMAFRRGIYHDVDTLHFHFGRDGKWWDGVEWDDGIIYKYS